MLPSSGYKWLDLLIALLVFLVVVWAIITIAGMIFDNPAPAAVIETVVPMYPGRFRIG